MRLGKKSLSRVALLDLLRRRRTDLKRFLADNGIVSYELLVSRCSSMGVLPPDEAAFRNAMGNPAVPELSSPTEGIVIVAPSETNEDHVTVALDGRLVGGNVTPEEQSTWLGLESSEGAVESPSQDTTKGRRPKKKSPTNDG